MRHRILVVLVVTVPAAIWAQSPGARSEFEVASIKRNVSGDLNNRFMPAVGRLSVINMTLKDLLATAYQIRDFQISGGPGWIDSERYDI
jgi:uncharacterized protein (TIGR03435 family)